MSDAGSNTPMFKCVGPRKVRVSLLDLRPFFIFSLALIFLTNSLGGDLLVGEAWAAKASGLPSVGPETAGSPTPLKNLSADTFSLPQELGYIQESVKFPESKKTVVHIQDAHCNYAAQKSISQLLNYLTAEYGIYAVNCEGGAQDYDLSIFTSIPEKDIREKTSDYFVKEGVVSAAEYFAVNNPQKVKLWGVEDADLYIKNLKVYRESLTHKDEVDRYLKSINYILNNLKRRIYSAELLEFDAYYTRYKDGKISFKEYMAYLIKAASEKLIDIKSFSNIYLLSQTLQEEDKIDFRSADNEKDEVVDKLKKILSRNELEELILKVGGLKTEQISQADFYAYLVKKAKSIKLDISSYPELQKYIIYISLYGAIDRARIAKEMDTLEDKIKEALYENDTQRELGILSKNLILTKNIFNISVTRDDYTYYKAHIATFAVSNYVSFIDRIAPLYKIQAGLDKNITMLDRYRGGMDLFYECSLERDRAFIKNIKFTDHDRPNSIIITGGFHTENLRELFKNENVSYISIMPKFKNEKDYESPYLKRLAGQRTALENVINTAIPAILNLQVVEILSKLGVMVEGEANIERFRLVVQIVAGINRTGNAILRMTSKDLNLPASARQDDKIILFTKGDGEAIENQEFSPSNFNVSRANAENADIILLNTQTFAFKLMAPQTQPQIAQALSAPALQGERHITPLNPPEGQGPSFFGNLVGNNGKPVTSTAGFVFDVSDRSVILTPPGMPQIVVTVAADESGNVITGSPKQLASSLGALVMQPGLLNEEEKGRISALIGGLGSVSKVIAVEDQGAAKAFFRGDTLYISKNIIDNPLLIVRPEVLDMYASAQLIVPEIAKILRRGSPTWDISPAASEEDIAPQTSNNRTAEQILGKQGHEIHAKSYLAKGDWVKNLKDLLEKTLPDFAAAQPNPTTRMAIRLMPDVEGLEGRVIKEIKSAIQKFFESRGYSEQQIKEIFDRQVHFIPIRIENVEHLNSSIDLFTDLGMMEIDRYIRGDYPDELPPELRDRFLALLKLSITNFDDLMKLVKTEEDIIGILNAIFKINILLRIRPVDWKSMDEWKKAQDAILQSV